MGNYIHGVNYDAVKNTVEYTGYTRYIYSVLFTSFYCMGENKVYVLFSYYDRLLLFYGMKCLVPFLRILLFLRINIDCIALIQSMA